MPIMGLPLPIMGFSGLYRIYRLAINQLHFLKSGPYELVIDNTNYDIMTQRQPPVAPGRVSVICLKHDTRHLRTCSHEPGTVNYPGVMIAPGQALPRVHMLICCPGATLPRVNFIARDKFIVI